MLGSNANRPGGMLDVPQSMVNNRQGMQGGNQSPFNDSSQSYPYFKRKDSSPASQGYAYVSRGQGM